MIEELNKLNALSTEGLARIRSIQAATKLLDKAQEYSKTIIDEVSRLKTMLNEVKAVADRIAQGQIDAAKGVAPVDIARQFKSVVDTVQTELASMGGSVGTTLRGFDVELKCVVVVENDQAHMVLPPPTEKLEAHQVSTFKMSFGTVPLTRTEKPLVD